MACRSSGSSIPGPSTSAARCRSSSACSHGARDTFHWKVFDRRRIVTTERSARARWRWSVTAAFGLGGITISAWGPRLPAIKAGLGISTATIGLLLAGVTVGAILGLLGSTPVLHWLGSRRAIAAALLLITAALAVMGLALIVGSVPLVAVAFVIVGLGIGTLDVLINVEGAAVERPARRWASLPRLSSSPKPFSSRLPPWRRRLGSRAGAARRPGSRRSTGQPGSASGCAAGWTGG